MTIHHQGAFSRTSVPLPVPGSRLQPAALYGAGAEIYGQGQKAGNIFQVEFGAVRVYRLLADGRRQISAFYFAGEVFGFESDTHHHFFAEALCATGIRTVLENSGTDLSQQLLPLVLKSFVRSQEHLLVLGRQNAAEKVAAFLLEMAERQGGLESFDLPMSRLDIGDYLGMSIETVCRVLTSFRAKGIIRLRSQRTVEILKTDALHWMSE